MLGEAAWKGAPLAGGWLTDLPSMRHVTMRQPRAPYAANADIKAIDNGKAERPPNFGNATTYVTVYAAHAEPLRGSRLR